jgi:acetyl esterase/lipase
MRQTRPAKELPEVPDLVRLLEAWGKTAIPVCGSSTKDLRRLYPDLQHVRVKDLLVVREGRKIPARLYERTDRISGNALVWIHGGAFLMGDLDMPEAHWVAMMLAETGVRCVTLDYAKAVSGVDFRALNEDLAVGWSAALAALHQSAGPELKVHLGGASAGANLAVCLSKRLRDMGMALPHSLMLAYPLLHAELPDVPAGVWRAIEEEPRAIRFTPRWVSDLGVHYAGAAATTNPFSFAANGHLGDLPTCLAMTCGRDSLRVSGEAFVAQLLRSGVPARIHHEPEAVHGCLNEPGNPCGENLLQVMSSWIGLHAGEQKFALERNA